MCAFSILNLSPKVTWDFRLVKEKNPYFTWMILPETPQLNGTPQRISERRMMRERSMEYL